MTVKSSPGAAHLRQNLGPGTAACVGWAFIFAILVAAVAIGADGAGRAGIELGLRLTARLAFLLFWPCYVAGALVVLFGPRFMPLKQRARDLGLAFAAVLAVHLGLVVALCAIGSPPALRVFVIFGPGAVWAALLAIASNNAAGLALGATGGWLLRNVAMNYLAFDFAVDFVRPQPLNSTARQIEYLPFAAFALLGPTLRALAWFGSRLRRRGAGRRSAKTDGR